MRDKKIQVPPDRVPLLVVLVTPAHLQLLDDGSIFIPLLLERTIGLSPPGQVSDVMVAVVDRIPHMNSTNRGSASQDDTAADASQSGVLPRDGQEGISVAVLDSTSAAPDLLSPREKSNERETMTIQQRCTVSFSIPPSIHVFTTSQKRGYQALVPRKLQLPVANTLFLNGKTSTLYAQRWILQPVEDKDAAPIWILTKRTSLPRQDLNMANFFPIKDKSPDHSLYSHLTRITPSRIITAAVGNIIRRLGTGRSNANHGDGQPGTKEEEVPASTELEAAINKGIQEGRISSQPTGVWALLRPRNAALALRTTWWGDGPDKLQRAILSGCRLHKVLSGGGGWGEKQGLLALDPDSDYISRQQALQSPFEDTQSVEAEKIQALGEVVKPGDKVMFFVCKSPEPIVLPRGSQREQSLVSDAAVPKLTFGSLPSTMDAMPTSIGAETNDATMSDCIMVNNHFGMLSEQGMSLEVSLCDRLCSCFADVCLQSTFYSQVISAGNPISLARVLRKNSSPAFKKGHRTTITTKLDAPYTLFSITGKTHESFPEYDDNEIDERISEHGLSQIDAKQLGSGPSTSIPQRAVTKRASPVQIQGYRLGSSGQRALASDKVKIPNTRCFTTSLYHRKTTMWGDNVHKRIYRNIQKMRAQSEVTTDPGICESPGLKEEGKKARRNERRSLMLKVKDLRKRAKSEQDADPRLKSLIRAQVELRTKERRNVARSGWSAKISRTKIINPLKQEAANEEHRQLPGELQSEALLTPRFTAPGETLKKELFQESGTDLPEDMEPFKIRRHLAAATAPASRLDASPDTNVALPGSKSQSEADIRESIRETVEDRNLWMSQNDARRTSQIRRLYQDQGPLRRTKDLPYIPVEGSSIIRYEASDKSQRLKDAYAMKKFEDGFTIRKHGTVGAQITKHGGGDSEIDMGKGREYDEEKQKNAVSAGDLKQAVSAREYAKGLHSEYRSNLGEWE